MPVKTVPRVTYILYGSLALGWVLVYVKMSEEAQGRFDAAIEALAANIRFAGAAGEPRAIAITSSVPNEGKTRARLPWRWEKRWQRAAAGSVWWRGI